MIDEILEKAGLKYEDLNSAEKETLSGWLQALGKSEITVDGVRTYIAKMKAGVEADLTKTDLNTKQDLFLKARMRNYMLMEAFLTSPLEAKKALEAAITGIKLDKK
jgi:hypothetical protein